jgi:hypothetical protein
LRLLTPDCVRSGGSFEVGRPSGTTRRGGGTGTSAHARRGARGRTAEEYGAVRSPLMRALRASAVARISRRSVEYGAGCLFSRAFELGAARQGRGEPARSALGKGDRGASLGVETAGRGAGAREAEIAAAGGATGGAARARAGAMRVTVGAPRASRVELGATAGEEAAEGWNSGWEIAASMAGAMWWFRVGRCCVKGCRMVREKNGTGRVDVRRQKGRATTMQGSESVNGLGESTYAG